MIFFIIGSSGVGKSSVLPKLKKRQPSVNFHDFDDIGVPENADKIWRQQSTNAWLEKAAKEKGDTCILGGAVPGEILATPCYKKYHPEIKICLLDCTDEVRYQRLIERQSYGPNQDIMNWASWLRLHCLMPNWQSHVIIDNAWQDMDFKEVQDKMNWRGCFDCSILDNSYDSVEETCEKLIQWMSINKT